MSRFWGKMANREEIRVSEFWSTFKYPKGRTIAPIASVRNEVCPNLGSFGTKLNSLHSKNCLFSKATSKFGMIATARPFAADFSALGQLSKTGNTAF